MAKKVVGISKKSSSASSSKTVKSSPPKKSNLKAAKVVKATAAKKTTAKKTSRVSYKQEYIKLLQKTNKTLTKEIRGIKKAIEQPDFKVAREPIDYSYEAFPKEPSVTPKIKNQPAKSIEQQILEQLQDIELQIRSRDMAFEDLVSGSAKLGGQNGYED
jgi:hypothetical protein